MSLSQGEIGRIAAKLTEAAVSKLVVPTPPTLPALNADGTITIDKPMLSVNLYVWEEFRIFYNAVEQLPSDPKDWPVPAASGNTPPASAAANMPNLVPFLQKVAAATGVPFASDAAALLGLIQGGSSPAATTQPAPLSPSAAAGS